MVLATTAAFGLLGCASPGVVDDTGAAGGWGPLAVAQPSELSLEAQARGVLEVAASCAYLLGAGERLFLVWPGDRTAWRANDRSIALKAPDGSSVLLRDGDTVSLAGGGAGGREAGPLDASWANAVDWLVRPDPDCDTSTRWFVGAWMAGGRPAP